MCISKILYFFLIKKINKETQTMDKKTRETFIQTENNNNNSISQTEINMENLMEFSNEDWYKLVWTNPTWDKEELIDFKK